ncbi:MAG: hypothetical protein Q8P41_31880 [Pseudomonadota bacterium]|nr:hypothetical protein [Pseudomonadota bacterium]
MSWALFLDHDGRAKVDFYAFVLGRPLISEHLDKRDAETALLVYRERARREASEALGQKELFR